MRARHRSAMAHHDLRSPHSRTARHVCGLLSPTQLFHTVACPHPCGGGINGAGLRCGHQRKHHACIATQTLSAFNARRSPPTPTVCIARAEHDRSCPQRSPPEAEANLVQGSARGAGQAACWGCPAASTPLVPPGRMEPRCCPHGSVLPARRLALVAPASSKRRAQRVTTGWMAYANGMVYQAGEPVDAPTTSTTATAVSVQRIVHTDKVVHAADTRGCQGKRSGKPERESSAPPPAATPAIAQRAPNK